MSKPVNIDILVCAECGSEEIEMLKWVDVQTNKVIEDGPEGQHSQWCRICEERVKFKLKTVEHYVNGSQQLE